MSKKPKKRVYEIAKELNIENKILLEIIKSMNIDVKSHMSTLDENTCSLIRRKAPLEKIYRYSDSDIAPHPITNESLTYSKQLFSPIAQSTKKPIKYGPIKLTQDNSYFFVSIHPENRDRAKKIIGRQWDGERRAWVYPKNLDTYNALTEEFKNDADVFDIQRPKIIPTKKAPPEKINNENDLIDVFDKKTFIEMNSLNEGHYQINTQLSQIQDILESITDLTSAHSRHFEDLREGQEIVSKAIIGLKPSPPKKVEPKKIEILPETLTLNRQKELQLIEKVLINIAYETSGKKESFFNWMIKHAPLERPAEFVTATHELIKEQLEKLLVGDVNTEISFGSLIYQNEKENNIYIKKDDPVKVFIILRTLNDIRNRFGHPRGIFSPYERWARSILYLMNLALIWNKIMITGNDDNE